LNHIDNPFRIEKTPKELLESFNKQLEISAVITNNEIEIDHEKSARKASKKKSKKNPTEFLDSAVETV